MREILFRGKNPVSSEWAYGSLVLEKNAFDERLILAIISDADGNETLVNPETVGQYTGLKDLHGTRIFEGDVVKSIAAWCVVEFENGGYGLRPFGKGKLIPIMGHGNFNENEVEVIGNVFDNPELLEGDKT